MPIDLSIAPFLTHAPSQYFQPAPALAGCVRVIIGRNTMGWNLAENAQLNYLPTLLTCCLTWVVEGALQIKTKGHRRAMARMAFSGPQTMPAITANVGPVQMVGVMLYPDAFHRMTGIYPGDLVNRTVPMQDVLPNDWMDWAHAVLLSPTDAQRHQAINEFLLKRWTVCKDPHQKIGPSFQDWINRLQKTTDDGLSQRQVERLIKRWTGQNLRGLQGVARAEQAFFYAFQGLLRGDLSWREVALQSGFADQSHLCRETKRFTGFSPDDIKNGMLNDEAFWIYRLWACAF